MEFETGEEVIWTSRAASYVRYPVLTLLFFIGIFVINLGPVGQAVGATSFILMIIFLILTIVSLILTQTKKYYLTNRRIISRKASLSVQDLSNVRVEQSMLARLRGVGNVYFDSRDGRWIIFKHVKDPEQIVQSGLNLRGTTPSVTSTMFCNYCGARLTPGIARCPNCGADL